MHEYYAKKQDKLRKELHGYFKLIAAELEHETGLGYAELFEEVFQVYREEFLERFPYIGGDKASGTRNLTGAFGFVALGVVLRKRGKSLERWGQLITLCYQRYFGKMPGFVKAAAGKMFTNPKLATKMLKKKDEKNRKNAILNPGSFETKTQEPTEEYPVIYHTVVCPLADFARTYGYMEYMPYLCNLDYAMFEAFGVPFYREKTCANGDAYCDFKLKPGAPVVPAWPCHGLDENDPLR